MNGLHKAIAKGIVESKGSLTNAEFKFLRVELNISQKALGEKFDVSEQTIARYEKKQKPLVI
jgi:putative transcriptional regulator